MTDVIVTTEQAAATDERGSYIDWPAIIAGVVLASAISLVLIAFGAAVGLSFTSFHAASTASAVWVAIAAATWLLWVQVSSFMAGGYLTGRMRRRFHDASEHESDVRDGAHGLLVWAGGLIIGAVIAVSGVGTAVQAVGNAAGTAVTAVSNMAEGGGTALDPNAYFVDTLFRSERATASAESRAEVGRILIQAATGPVPDADRAYMATLVARETGLSQADAEARVTEVTARIDAARAEAVSAAETARKTGILGAFLTAAALLVSAAGAYWAASMGGRHRDEHTVFATVFRRY